MVAPLVAAAGISAVGSVLGGITGGKGAKKAAKTAAAAQQAQINYLNANRDYQYNLNAPSIQGGNAADDRIRALLGLGGDTAAANQAYADYRGSTHYDRRLSEALQSVNQRAFAGGQGQSGAALKALQDRGAYVAGQDFNTYLSQLGGVSATGANARGLVANVGGQSTNQFLNASQVGTQNQIGAINAGTANTQSTIQNLMNAGAGALSSYAYGSSYGNSGGGYSLGGAMAGLVDPRRYGMTPNPWANY